MTNAQLYLAVGLPIIAVLASLVLSMFQISGLRDEMRLLRTELRGDMNHGFEMLVGRVNHLSDRLARVEERLSK